MKWEYKFLSSGSTGVIEFSKDWKQQKLAESNSQVINVFERLGNEGWELCLHDGHYYVFKRPKQ
jgi:hypothetical protein